MKDYLTFENQRNARNRELFERLLKAAHGDGCKTVLVVHHLTFELEGHPPNEIPSADTLMFDHDLMFKVFGEEAIPVMARLAALPCDERDALMKELLDARDSRDPDERYC